jgi:nucleotide-binding universal stress UspA family protein
MPASIKASDANALSRTGAIRSIAVIVADTPGDEFAVNTALVMAKASQATVELMQLLYMPVPLIPGLPLVPESSLREIEYDIREAARVAGQAIVTRLDANGLSSHRIPIEASPGHMEQMTARVSRRCDLALIAGPYRSPAETSTLHGLFATLLLESGRPVLVVPSRKVDSEWPRRAVLAWADTPECARAINDALPLLKACHSVELLIVDPRTTLLESAQQVGLDTMQHLAAHGIDAKVHTRKSFDKSTAATILDYVDQTEADLLVIGGYGHRRLREWIFGGTTREIYLGSRVHTLFAH